VRVCSHAVLPLLAPLLAVKKTTGPLLVLFYAFGNGNPEDHAAVATVSHMQATKARLALC
jgi:hypothetical protein